MADSDLNLLAGMEGFLSGVTSVAAPVLSRRATLRDQYELDLLKQQREEQSAIRTEGRAFQSKLALMPHEIDKFEQEKKIEAGLRKDKKKKYMLKSEFLAMTPEQRNALSEQYDEVHTEDDTKKPESEARDESKSRVSGILGEMKDLYGELKEGGGIVSTKRGGLANLPIRIAQSEVGQITGGLFGTENQRVRNEINQKLPLLINDIRKSTGMSARAMDSNRELQFYLQAATDPKGIVESNLSAIRTLELAYGTGEFSKEDYDKLSARQKSFVDKERGSLKSSDGSAPPGINDGIDAKKAALRRKLKLR